MDKAQATIVAKKIIEQFLEQDWKVCVHRKISHPIDGSEREIYIKLVVRSQTFSITEPLPKDFFSRADRTFDLSHSVASIPKLRGILDKLLKFLDELLGKMETTFGRDDVDILAEALQTQVSRVEDIDGFQPPGKLRLGETVFSIRGETTTKNLLPIASVQAIKAEMGMALGEKPEPVSRPA